MTEASRKPKRWLRFSLRSLLIVLTIFCVWLGWYLHRVEQQRAAVQWVVENGGTVYYDYVVPGWLFNFLSVDHFSTVTRVDCLALERSDITPLSGLTSLKHLSLDHLQATDLTALSGLTSLETLSLSHTQVNDLTPLSTLKNLKVLELRGSPVGYVKALAGLTNLEYLGFSSTFVRDVTPLAGLTNLKGLALGSSVSDVTILAGLTNLTDLKIHYTQVSDEDYEKLKQALPNCKFHNARFR